MRHHCNMYKNRAFTLVELLIATALTGFAVIGVVYCQLFGLRLSQLAESKAGASDQARASFNDLTMSIRAAKLWAIGNYNETFKPIAIGSQQKGNALKVHPSIDTNIFYIYYFNTNKGQLNRISTNGSTKLLVGHLTNSMTFQAETPRGDIQTDLSHKGVIFAQMELAEYQYPLTRIGSNYYYNYYRLSFRVTSHIPDGP